MIDLFWGMNIGVINLPPGPLKHFRTGCSFRDPITSCTKMHQHTSNEKGSVTWAMVLFWESFTPKNCKSVMNIKFERATPLKNRHMGMWRCAGKKHQKYDTLVICSHMLGSILFIILIIGKSWAFCMHARGNGKIPRMWLVGDSRLFEVFVEPACRDVKFSSHLPKMDTNLQLPLTFHAPT